MRVTSTSSKAFGTPLCCGMLFSASLKAWKRLLLPVVTGAVEDDVGARVAAAEGVLEEGMAGTVAAGMVLEEDAAGIDAAGRVLVAIDAAGRALGAA